MKKRVALILRSTYDSVRGGDSLQALATARELRKLGWEADLVRSRDSVDYRKYDLLHLFNIIRPADHLTHIHRSGLPYLVSTIYLDYAGFDRLERSWPARWVFRAAGKNGAEYLKNGYRLLRGQDALASPSYLLGHRRAVRRILSGARMLLPNSHSEYRRLVTDHPGEFPFRVIPNGVDAAVFGEIPSVPRFENQVLCVGQVYGLKNQHRLIRAVRNMDVRLVLIGKPPPNHTGYYRYCRKISTPNVAFHDFMPQTELKEFYARSKVHALPSWFETTGLSSLEAGAMGCNLVVGPGGDTEEYFGGYASFCRADDEDSIAAALEAELNKPVGTTFREQVLERYTWARAAAETLLAYREVLGE